MGRGWGIPNFFLVTIFETPKNVLKHMISLFKMEGDVISDHFRLLWFQKDSMDTVGFRTFRNSREGGPGFLNKIVDFGEPMWHLDSYMYRRRGGAMHANLRIFPTFYQFFLVASLSGPILNVIAIYIDMIAPQTAYTKHINNLPSPYTAFQSSPVNFSLVLERQSQYRRFCL